MHFNTDTYPCMREGIIHKDEASKGKYLIAGSWFSSPSVLEGIGIDWIEPQEREVETALNKVQQAQIKDFIRGYYSGLELKSIYFFHEQAMGEEATIAPMSVVLVTPTPAAIQRAGDDAAARLEQALATQLGRPVTVSVCESKASEGVRLDFSVFWKQNDDGSYSPKLELD